MILVNENVLKVRVGYFKKSRSKNCRFQMGILHVLLDSLPISLLPWLYDMSGYFWV